MGDEVVARLVPVSRSWIQRVDASSAIDDYRRLSTRTLVSWLERRDHDRGLDRATGMGWDGTGRTGNGRTDGRAGGDGCAGCAMELGFYQARCPTSYGPVRRVHTYVSMAIAPMGQSVFRIRCTGRGTTQRRITPANCRRGTAAILTKYQK